MLVKKYIMLEKRLNIGISFFLDDNTPDIWSNGAIQNVIFLYLLLEKVPSVAKVTLVHTGNRTTPTQGLNIDDVPINFAPLNEAVSTLDILIEAGVMIEPAHADIVHQNNGKVISYRMGNDFIMEMESFLFDKNQGRFFNGAVFDAVWTIPQHERTCRSYFGIMMRAPIYILPHIWSPMFVQKVIDSLKVHNIEFGYKPGAIAKRISNFEANVNVLKTSHIPILICEQAYRQAPELIQHAYMCNTFHKKDHHAFHNFIGRTDIVRNNILSVEPRYAMPDFLSRYTDIVIAHQWENALNYSYYDALYGGYPLIHNSDMLPVGYHYRSFDAYDGANVLLDVIRNHDKHYMAYNQKAEAFLQTLALDYPKNIQAHEKALCDLFS